MRVGLLLGILAILWAPASASAQTPARGSVAGSGLIVTLAARECPNYQDIRANLARNNIMESLQDLGQDTLYTSGEPINPKLELLGQPACKPISGWEFTLGSGLLEKASTGSWGALSIVTGAESPTEVTEPSTPLLGWNGEPIGKLALRGAVTFELNAAQAERATRNALWVQGGTPGDPLLYEVPEFAGKYGFGALRCSIDNLNGDNVETVAFPSGTTHAFCYAYYVTPPPSAGTIVIRKEVKGLGPAAETFHFGGNVSYNPGGAFDLAAAKGSPAEQTFFRAETRPGDRPWRVSEEVPDGWVLARIRCESGGSRVLSSRRRATVAIDLEAGDTVTCTYVDVLKPPEGALLLRKITEGGTGAFDLRVVDSSGDTVKEATVRTSREGVASYARPLILRPGRYRVLERPRRDPRGVWRLVSVSCNGSPARGDDAMVSISASRGALCTFTNRLTYKGRLTIFKEVIGNTGSAGFQITAPAEPALELNQQATATKERTPVLARGDSTRSLPFGTYVIQESAGDGTNAAGWSLAEVICDGKAVPFSQGRAVVRLTSRDPSARCRFVNLFTPGPAPQPSPGPAPEPGGEAAEIAVSKTLVSAGTGPVPTDVYRIEVRNLSGVTASGVVVTDEPGPGLVIVAAEPSAGGSCVQATQYICSFDSIEPHGEATVTVKAKDYGGGSAYNRAVVGSASPDPESADNVASASAESPVRHYPACGSRVGVAARC
jgi:uncharacterized repeat protein (TIGR01451 family)